MGKTSIIGRTYEVLHGVSGRGHVRHYPRRSIYSHEEKYIGDTARKTQGQMESR